MRSDSAKVSLAASSRQGRPVQGSARHAPPGRGGRRSCRKPTDLSLRRATACFPTAHTHRSDQRQKIGVCRGFCAFSQDSFQKKAEFSLGCVFACSTRTFLDQASDRFVPGILSESSRTNQSQLAQIPGRQSSKRETLCRRRFCASQL